MNDNREAAGWRRLPARDGSVLLTGSRPSRDHGQLVPPPARMPGWPGGPEARP